MILWCLFAAAGFAPAADADATPFGAAVQSEPELVVRVEETRLTAESASAEPKLLVFAFGEHEAQRLVWLPAGGRVESAFPRGAAEGLLLEVVERGPAGWTRSGAHRVAPAREIESLELVFHASGVVLAGAAGGPAGVDLAVGSLLSPALRARVPSHAESALPDPEAAPLHVPIPQPSEQPPGDAPPKLEKRPLPPV